MIGNFFEPAEKICLIFDCVDYERLRELPEFASEYPDDDFYGSLRNKLEYADMPRAREWADCFD